MVKTGVIRGEEHLTWVWEREIAYRKT
jgi:hypothetical protein